MITLYRLLTYIAVPFILARLWWRGRRSPAYRQRWSERFAWIKVPAAYQQGLWIHAVSVGEVLAAIPLVKAISQRYPHLPLVLTTMTPTGSARVRANLGDSVFHVYVPYDICTVVNRFLKRAKPKAVMILETELWPNILLACGKRNIPIMMANARLSENSYHGYHKFPCTIRKLLNNITLLAAHAEEDAERFIALGVDAKRVVVTGSIKFEINTPASLLEQAVVLRNSIGKNRPTWIAASTHEGEEIKILDAHRTILKQYENALLVLVPRHPERFNKIADLCEKENFNTLRRSSNKPCTSTTQIYLADTMGELMLLFAVSDVAFVGGSLIERGGHNVLEPASLGIPTLIGPYHFNFTSIIRLMKKTNALIEVNSVKELADHICHLFSNSVARSELGERGRSVVENNRGALQKHLTCLKDILGE